VQNNPSYSDELKNDFTSWKENVYVGLFILMTKKILQTFFSKNEPEPRLYMKYPTWEAIPNSMLDIIANYFFPCFFFYFIYFFYYSKGKKYIDFKPKSYI